MTNEEDLAVVLARLEGKVDAALAHQGTRIDEHSRMVTDHEERLRAVEARATVSPRQLWATTSTALILVFAALSALHTPPFH